MSSPDLSPCVCVADDDPSVRKAVSAVLRRHGFLVYEAIDAASAIEVLQTEPVELLVSDINMPGNENLELLEEDAVARAGVPVLLITGDPTVGTAVRALRLQVVDYITKPIDPASLVARAAEGVKAGRQRRALRTAVDHAGELRELLGTIQSLGPAGLRGPDGDPIGEATPQWHLSAEELSLLSTREREVIGHLVRGIGTAEVAKRLFISQHTVRNHLKRIFKKLRVGSQVELVCRVLGTSRTSPSPT